MGNNNNKNKKIKHPIAFLFVIVLIIVLVLIAILYIDCQTNNIFTSTSTILFQSVKKFRDNMDVKNSAIIVAIIAAIGGITAKAVKSPNKENDADANKDIIKEKTKYKDKIKAIIKYSIAIIIPIYLINVVCCAGYDIVNEKKETGGQPSTITETTTIETTSSITTTTEHSTINTIDLKFDINDPLYLKYTSKDNNNVLDELESSKALIISNINKFLESKYNPTIDKDERKYEHYKALALINEDEKDYVSAAKNRKKANGYKQILDNIRLIGIRYKDQADKDFHLGYTDTATEYYLCCITEELNYINYMHNEILRNCSSYDFTTEMNDAFHIINESLKCLKLIAIQTGNTNLEVRIGIFEDVYNNVEINVNDRIL